MKKNILDLEEIIKISNTDFGIIETKQGAKKININLFNSNILNFEDIEEIEFLTDDDYTLIKTEQGNKKIKANKLSNHNCINFNDLIETNFNESEYVIVGNNNAKKLLISKLKASLIFDINNKEFDSLETRNKLLIKSLNEIYDIVKSLEQDVPPIEPPITDDEVEPPTEVIIENVTLNYSNYTLTKNKTLQLVATITPSNHDKDINWKSSNTSIATVDNNGLVKSIANKGTSIITVTCGGKSATCTITASK